jgi:hypothetical protein
MGGPVVAVRSGLHSALSHAMVLPIITDLLVGVSMRIDFAPSKKNGLRVAAQVMVEAADDDSAR